MWGVAGLAGVVGYYVGGVMTQNGFAKESFFIGGSVGILINISACFLDRTLEDNTKHVVRMGCWERTKHNFRQIKKGF